MKRLLLPAGVFVLFLSACGAGHVSAPPATSSTALNVVTVAAHRDRAAEARAEKLLLRIPLPSGAVRLRRAPHDANLRDSGLGTSVLTMFAEQHGFWRVRASVADVMAFEKRHMLQGLQWGTGDGPRGGYQGEGFYAAPRDGHPMQRMVSVSADRVGGRTVVRVDAAVAWIYPRSRSEELPAGVTEVDIRGAGVHRNVTGPADVSRIVRSFGTLTVTPPGANVICGADLSVPVHFSFRSRSGKLLASAVVPSEGADGCNPVQFTLGGAEQTPLIDARFGKYAFAARVQRLLGVCFRDPARKCR